MTLLAGAAWTPTDDDGTGTTGTPIDAAWVAAVKASIETLVHSAVNPTVTPEDVIDEVVTGRGGQASLDARFDAIDAILASVVTVPTVAAVTGQQNMANNDIFRLWHLGDTSAPTHWKITGAGATVARCGTGLADTNRKIHDFSARLRRVAADSTLTHSIFNATDFALVSDALIGERVGLGAWVRCTTSGKARVFINDGVGTTYSSAVTLANTWQWLTVERVIAVGAATLEIGVINDQDGADAYLSAVTCVLVPTGAAPTHWIPAPTLHETHTFVIPGAVAVATPKFRFQPPRPCIVELVMLSAGVAPTGADLIVDVNTWDGAAYTSMYAGGSRPQIAASGTIGGGTVPDGTYARRCTTVGGGVLSAAGEAISIDIDQVGSGVAGSDLTISIRTLRYLRMWESVLSPNFVGVL